ncbi:hypothetical protein PI124_g8403 [Phytophthora idaei]|nr:hypothetical protein PI125_g8270 [Phytophthora idaei]KAG3159110.1 hypothetical protein PI126_g7558 [Phytophthora idaei]KAG3246882.1 hypothetical protein PI124_g8403 [Phytophthora idaei]
MAVFELHDHFTTAQDVRKKVTPLRQKEFCKEMAEQGLKLVRIRNAMKVKMQLSENSAPTLRMVQNLVNYYSRTKLWNNDRYQKIVKMVQDAAFTGDEEETQPFMFGWDLDQNGNPVVGNGSDEKPFSVGCEFSSPVAEAGS